MQIPWTFRFAIITFLDILSQQAFAHVTTVLLPGHDQNFAAITMFLFG